MIVSVTEIQTFMRCPQKWQLTSFNRAGLEPIIKAPALALGTLIHKTKEDWCTALYVDGYAPDTKEADPRLIYQRLSQEALAQIVMGYRERVGANPGGAELIGVTKAIELGAHMIENYFSYWGAPISDDMRLIKAEQTLKVPIPSTEHCDCRAKEQYGRCSCTSNCLAFFAGIHTPMCECQYNYIIGQPRCECIVQHILECTLDGLMYHKINGAYYILENKTFAAHPTIQELRRNFQFLCYTWAARESLQQDVRGLAYDGLWKRPGIPKDAKGNPRTNSATREPYTLDDLFLRLTIVPNQSELESLPHMLAIAANAMASYPQPTGRNNLKTPVRIVPPVRGCVIDDKQNILLCDQIWRDEDASMTLRHYTKRERTLAFVGVDEDAEE